MYYPLGTQKFLFYVSWVVCSEERYSKRYIFQARQTRDFLPYLLSPDFDRARTQPPEYSTLSITVLNFFLVGMAGINTDIIIFVYFYQKNLA